MTVSKKSYLAALYSSQILDMKETGLTEWFLESFAGEDAVLSPGAFHIDDGVPLPSIFRMIVPELDQDVLNFAKKAVQMAMNGVDPRGEGSGNYLGLYTLTALGEALGCTGHFQQVSRILNAWIGPNQEKYLKEPKCLDDVLCLREILECAFRTLYSAVLQKKGDESLTDLNAWAYNTLGGSAPDRQFTPVWAPLFFLATYHSQRNNLEQKFLLGNLERGNIAIRDGHFEGISGLFLYADETGRRYPYDIGPILGFVPRFEAIVNISLGRRVSKRRYRSSIEDVSARMARRERRIFNSDTIQVTSGGFQDELFRASLLSSLQKPRKFGTSGTWVRSKGSFFATRINMKKLISKGGGKVKDKVRNTFKKRLCGVA